MMSINTGVRIPFAYGSSKQCLDGSNFKAEICDRIGLFDKIATAIAKNYVNFPEGNIAKESYRLSTFASFPKSAAKIVSPVLLSKNGFMYTGYKDNVKCFSCGRILRKFTIEEGNNHFRDWHKDDCSFNHKTPSLNIPVQYALNIKISKIPIELQPTVEMAQTNNSRSKATANLNQDSPCNITQKEFFTYLPLPQ